jgi:trigger factor
MQISIETTSGLERRLTISVPSETFEDQITSRLGKAAGQVRLPGYRPGKIPLKEIRRRYGPAVRAEVAGELMQSSFVEAIQREELAPAGSPSLQVVKMDPGLDFEFTATFEVFPLVELADLGKVVVKKPQADITDSDVAVMIEQLREQRKTWADVERPVQDADQVTLDFSGTIDGEAFAGGSGEDMVFVVGAGQMIEDFDQGVHGLTVAETAEFSATFPADYQTEELRGKTASFSVTIKKVAESELPELNAEFFKGFEVADGGMEAFREEIQANMQRELGAALSGQIKTQVMDQLHALHTLQLPSAMISREIEVLKNQMLQQFQMYGQGSGAPDIDLPDDLFKEQAERRVAVGLIVNEVVSSANLEPAADRVKERIETMAAGYAEPQQVISYYYGNAEQLQQIEMAVLEDQVVDHILEQANVEIIAASYSAVINGSAIAPAGPVVDEDAAEDPAAQISD